MHIGAITDHTILSPPRQGKNGRLFPELTLYYSSNPRLIQALAFLLMLIGVMAIELEEFYPIIDMTTFASCSSQLPRVVGGLGYQSSSLVLLVSLRN